VEISSAIRTVPQGVWPPAQLLMVPMAGMPVASAFVFACCVLDGGVWGIPLLPYRFGRAYYNDLSF
jgi:hypothetical protein